MTYKRTRDLPDIAEAKLGSKSLKPNLKLQDINLF